MRAMRPIGFLAMAAWLAACTTPGSEPPRETPKASYRVVGTEPFWGVRVDGDALHFTTLDDQVGKHLQATPTSQPDGVRDEGSDGATGFRLDLQRGACSDGMSDKTYAFKAAVRYGQTDYSGCAESVD